MDLTKRQQETFEVIKASGGAGIGYKKLKATLKVRGNSTLRQRLSQLVTSGKVSSTRDGRFATYRAK